MVNISASIPLLKPLVDLCFGAGVMDSSQRSSRGRLGFGSRGPSGAAIELKDTRNTYGARSFNTNKPRTNSMTVTRMIAKAAGDNESQETILDDSLSESHRNMTQTEPDVDNSRPNSQRMSAHNKYPFEDSRASTGAKHTGSGISCTTEITVQYSRDDNSISKDGPSQQGRNWT